VVPQPQITNKPHDNILKDIRRILEETGIGAVRFDSSYLSEQNKSLICFKLPRYFVRKVAIKPIQADFGTMTALDELISGLAVCVWIALRSNIYDQKALITAWGSMKTTTISDNKTQTMRIQGKSTLTSLQWYLPPTL